MTFNTNISPQAFLMQKLTNLHDNSGLSWREIANGIDFHGIPPGTLCRFAKHGYLPEKWKPALGIPITASVIVIGDGIIPPGCQVTCTIGRCKCGTLFLSNHPRRRSCFVCSPSRSAHAPR